MLPHDVLAGQEADDMPQAAVGPRTVSGYPVSHRSPLASCYAAVITVRGLRTPSTGWNLPTAVQTAPTSTGAVRVHVGSVRPGRSARVDSGIAAGWGHGAALLCVNQSRLPRPGGVRICRRADVVVSGWWLWRWPGSADDLGASVLFESCRGVEIVVGAVEEVSLADLIFQLRGDLYRAAWQGRGQGSEVQSQLVHHGAR